MKLNLFETNQHQLLNRAIKVYDRQHQAIAKNIANASNPEFNRVNTDFSQVLKQVSDGASLKTTAQMHIGTMQLDTDSQNPVTAGDGNQEIDFTREMADMAENQIRYEFSANAMARYFKGISNAIVGRND